MAPGYKLLGLRKGLQMVPAKAFVIWLEGDVAQTTMSQAMSEQVLRATQGGRAGGRDGADSEAL